MPGSIQGGIKAAATNKKKYGRDFYKKIGQMGGEKSRGGGFARNAELATVAAKVGGRGGWSKLSKSETKFYKEEIKKAKAMGEYGDME